MGQKSQIYVRFQYNDKPYLIANYYGWNFGERMLSRARYSIEWIKTNIKYSFNIVEKLPTILDINFDFRDIISHSDILKEAKRDSIDIKKESESEYNYFMNTLNSYIFFEQDNSDGKLFLDIDFKKKKVKYAFLDGNCDVDNIMNGEAYMEWNKDPLWYLGDDYLSESDISRCYRHIKAIDKMAKLMNKEELNEFLMTDFKYLVEDDFIS